jgi:RNA polymerase sigma factor (sigma-70 family)
MKPGRQSPEIVAPIWRRRMHYVSGAFARVLGQRAEVEDLTQEVFLAICQTVYEGRKILDADAYLAGVIAKLIRRHFEQRERETCLDEPELVVHPVPDPPMIDEEDWALIQRLLMQLPWKKRFVVVACHYLGMNSREIGETLGLGRSTVEEHYVDAIDRLRRMAGRERWNPLEQGERVPI